MNTEGTNARCNSFKTSDIVEYDFLCFTMPCDRMNTECINATCKSFRTTDIVEYDFLYF